MFDKPVFVLGTPRTGTTLLSMILCHLLSFKHRYKCHLGEVFNYSFFKTESNLTELEYYQDRLNLILSDCFFIKILENQIGYVENKINVDLLKLITEKYDVIYIERKNYFEQALSWNYFLEKTYNFNSCQADKFKFNYKLMTWLFSSIERYKRIKTIYPSKYPTIFYEDFIPVKNKIRYLERVLNIDTNHLPKKEKIITNNLSANKIERDNFPYFDMVENKEYLMSFKKEIRMKISYLNNL